MSEERICGECGKAATGYASVQFEPLCNGDDDQRPTCYETVNARMRAFMAQASVEGAPAWGLDTQEPIRKALAAEEASETP